MESHLRDLLGELRAWGQANDAGEADYARKMLNLEPETAHLISILVRSGRRRQVLEIGTSNGYSTIWLAWAARVHDGWVLSIDHNPVKHGLAEANLRRAGLRERVELRQGDALELVAALPGPFDVVFLDADRRQYPDLLALLLPRLMPGALVLADNALSHPEEMAAYLAALTARPEFDHLVVPVGKGLSVAYRQEAKGG